MAALIRQANKRVQNTKEEEKIFKNKQTTTTNKQTNAWWKRRGKRKTKQKHFLKRKWKQEMSAGNETKAGYT